MLATMSEIDPRVDASLVDWSELDVNGLLPTGTVTLLLADVDFRFAKYEADSGTDPTCPDQRCVVNHVERQRRSVGAKCYRIEVEAVQ